VTRADREAVAAADRAALVGAAWERRYRARFEDLSRGGPRIGWNTEAALTPLWGLRRRIPSLSLAALAFPVLGVVLVDRFSLAVALVVPTLLFALLHGALGDWIYWRRLERLDRQLAKTADARRRQRLLAAARVGGVADYAVGTALLVPFAYLTILAAAPKGHPKVGGREHVATLKADLRNLVIAQDAYRREAGRYADVLAPWAYEASSGVHVRILYADSASFAADASSGTQPERCWIFMGEPRGLAAGMVEGEPFCTVPAASR